MMRLAIAAMTALLAAGPQDSARIADLVRKLDSPDWVEQAQAAKELAKIGQPVLGSLRAVMMSDSPSAKYWASLVSDAVVRNPGPSTAPPPPSDPEPAATPNPRGFAPGASDLGSLVFICNNPSHDAYEVVFSRCLTCSKVKRFAYDYGADVYRCAVCKKTYEKKDLKCDRCGQPPAPRMGIRMKSSGG
jgi:hypothetical protein